MNYIKLINQFWIIARSKNPSPIQAYMYFCLLQECNQRNWPKYFQLSNQLLCALIGISEKSLIEARKRLKDYGLIDFESGITKQKAPTYYLLDNCNKVSNEVHNGEVIKGVIEGVLTGTYNNKQNKTKQNGSKSHSGIKPVKDKTPHYEILKKTWFEFYEAKISREPTFNGVAAKSLQTIIIGLKKIYSKNEDWTEDLAINSFKNFLSKAYEDSWLKKNFLLNILASKFDAIVNPNFSNGNSNGNYSSKKVNGKQESINRYASRSFEDFKVAEQ